MGCRGPALYMPDKKFFYFFNGGKFHCSHGNHFAPLLRHRADDFLISGKIRDHAEFIQSQAKRSNVATGSPAISPHMLTGMLFLCALNDVTDGEDDRRFQTPGTIVTRCRFHGQRRQVLIRSFVPILRKIDFSRYVSRNHCRRRHFNHDADFIASSNANFSARSDSFCLHDQRFRPAHSFKTGDHLGTFTQYFSCACTQHCRASARNVFRGGRAQPECRAKPRKGFFPRTNAR